MEENKVSVKRRERETDGEEEKQDRAVKCVLEMSSKTCSRGGILKKKKNVW